MRGRPRWVNAIYNVDMLKKTTLIIFVLILVGGGVFVFLRFSGNTPDEGDSQFGEDILPISNKEVGSGNPSIIPSTDDLRKKFGSDDLIRFSNPKGDVNVNNFYKSSPFITEDGDADIITTDSYRIQYAGYNKTFYISISDEDIATAIRDAGEKFVSIMGISKQDACKLKIAVFVPAEFIKAAPPKTFTFCPSSE